MAFSSPQHEIAIPTLTDALDLVRGTPARLPWLDAELGSTLTTTAAGDHHAVTTEYHAYLHAEQADPLSDGDTDRDLETLHHQLTRPNSRISA
ncbi:hypothetical protein [Frankia sp. Cr1]|uniref:hypothetical protein n=1 Tax=Frankia sp. Cr1 TaxID=3073931 RepID=UPI002AD39AA3|nr:hypothetical protein [Frankia sp. Cr1]